MRNLFSKAFTKREAQPQVEERKCETIDSASLLTRIAIIRTDYQNKARDKKTRAFARGALATLDEITEIVKEMPRT